MRLSYFWTDFLKSFLNPDFVNFSLETPVHTGMAQSVNKINEQICS